METKNSKEETQKTNNLSYFMGKLAKFKKYILVTLLVIILFGINISQFYDNQSISNKLQESESLSDNLQNKLSADADEIRNLRNSLSDYSNNKSSDVFMTNTNEVASINPATYPNLTDDEALAVAQDLYNKLRALNVGDIFSGVSIKMNISNKEYSCSQADIDLLNEYFTPSEVARLKSDYINYIDSSGGYYHCNNSPTSVNPLFMSAFGSTDQSHSKLSLVYHRKNVIIASLSTTAGGYAIAPGIDQEDIDRRIKENTYNEYIVFYFIDGKWKIDWFN